MILVCLSDWASHFFRSYLIAVVVHKRWYHQRSSTSKEEMPVREDTDDADAYLTSTIRLSSSDIVEFHQSEQICVPTANGRLNHWCKCPTQMIDCQGWYHQLPPIQRHGVPMRRRSSVTLHTATIRAQPGVGVKILSSKPIESKHRNDQIVFLRSLFHLCIVYWHLCPSEHMPFSRRRHARQATFCVCNVFSWP